MSDPSPLLSVRAVSKAFADVIANDGVSLDIRAGQVHAILGENGAGKSTLMKILYGFYAPDAGSIGLDGAEVSIGSPADARRLGIGMVFQQFMLAPALTVLENAALGATQLPFVLPRAALRERLRSLSTRYGFQLDPDAQVRSLSLGEQQRLEILKLLLGGARVLIFDEPTSVLAPHEIDGLLDIFRRLRADGLAVVFITHKLREVLAVADCVTVLRRGRVTASLPVTTELTQDDLVQHMIGAGPGEPSAMDLAATTHHVSVGQDDAAKTVVLELSGVDAVDRAGRTVLHDISVEIRSGEIVGVAAVAGNGQTELGDLLAGLGRMTRGDVRLDGKVVKDWSVGTALRAGVGCLPEDPSRMAVVPGMSVLEHMALPDRSAYADRGGLRFRWDRVRQWAQSNVESTGIHIPALDRKVDTLSGGNLQRVIFAREVARGPRVLITFYPTRGLDVPTAETARAMLRGLRDRGTAVVLISEDLDELFDISDRLIVLHRGHLVGRHRPDETSVGAVGLLMTGANEGLAA